MSDDEDDYLSEKFLVEKPSASSSTIKSYSQLRKEAQKKSALKNEQNQIKTRREREIEAREEGLSKSLFEREEEEKAMGLSSGNKALSIMMKMGFNPGQSLGKQDDEAPAVPPEVNSDADSEVVTTATKVKHKAEPIALNEWRGRDGIGTRKRRPSPTAVDRIAKMAKMADATDQKDFRDRTRDEYHERRAEHRLRPAQRTYVTLDDAAGKSFNVLWLNPSNIESFPPGLLDALAIHTTLLALPSGSAKEDTPQARLRRQMQNDALHPLGEADDLSNPEAPEREYSKDELEEVTQFLRLNAQDRLSLLLSYLRDQYAYCFWCGTQYNDSADMDLGCPGEDEEEHD